MHSNTIPFKQPSMIWLNLSIDCIRVFNHGCAILVIMINYALDNTSNKHDVLTQCWFDFGPSSSTLAQHNTIIGSTYHVCCVLFLQISVAGRTGNVEFDNRRERTNVSIPVMALTEDGLNQVSLTCMVFTSC